MNTNLDLIKRIISNDDLCDKVNSMECKDTYIEQIKNYVLLLIKNKSTNDIPCIARYINKFVINNYKTKEDMIFDEIVMSSCQLNDTLIKSTLEKIEFYHIKEMLIRKYEQVITNNSTIDNYSFNRMILFYYYICDNFIMPTNYIDFFISNIVRKKIELNHNFLIYFYKQFSISYATSQKLNVSFEIIDGVINNDPYYDNKNNKIILYKQNIDKHIDTNIIADIFYQIKYLYLVKCIDNPNNKNYTYEQLQLVKEISLVSILGEDYFSRNFANVSFKNILKKQSFDTMINYFSKLGITINDKYVSDFILIDNDIPDNEDKNVSIDILFDKILKRENNNLIRELVRNYPVLGAEYKNNRRKNLLNLLIDIYNNKKLLVNLNKDLDWHNNKYSVKDEIVMMKINKLNDKIIVCNSYIGVMNAIINNSDYSIDGILDSIFALITYDTNDFIIKSDICTILKDVVPRKINKLCHTRNETYINNFKKKFINCYLDALGKISGNSDTSYFMKIYDCLDIIVKAFNNGE
ncbi:MAG: hypothetical protein J6D28_05950 [Bacilli bacterium]|nr:hypothetical protein [Bacilli bacterium]